jgi:hypothetical protein
LKKYDRVRNTAEKERYIEIIKDQPFYKSAEWKVMMDKIEVCGAHALF